MTTRIPSATYLLQFHSGFTFRAATDILAYFDDLGISDVYASPLFHAPAGSPHGYDVVDHDRLNPGLGTRADFRGYVAALQQGKMGQILDFVPNHMGTNESLNRWWTDVLANGVVSEFAPYFDIDWYPGKEAFAQKILLPILGDRYGRVLEKGELPVRFSDGAFELTYFDHNLPLHPATYANILRPVAERHPSAKLADLIAACDAVAPLAGQPGDPASFDRLHDLLERQVYRLSYWRLAAEEINYRRFFDINSLVAIRTEVPEVFEAAHELVLAMWRRGDITGLRIDHIDGLWNPREYLQRLKKHCASSADGPPRAPYLFEPPSAFRAGRDDSGVVPAIFRHGAAPVRVNQDSTHTSTLVASGAQTR